MKTSFALVFLTFVTSLSAHAGGDTAPTVSPYGPIKTYGERSNKVVDGFIGRVLILKSTLDLKESQPANAQSGFDVKAGHRVVFWSDEYVKTLTFGYGDDPSVYFYYRNPTGAHPLNSGELLQITNIKKIGMNFLTLFFGYENKMGTGCRMVYLRSLSRAAGFETVNQGSPYYMMVCDMNSRWTSVEAVESLLGAHFSFAPGLPL